MYKNANNVSPVLAVILTVIVAFLTFWFFNTGHVFWGVVFAVICVDFVADVILSFRKE